MAIEFDNPILAGTTLVREAIRSQNYQPGSAGWQISADGAAEFADLLIRSTDGSGNTVTVSNGVIEIRNAAGIVVSRISADGYKLYRASDGLLLAESTLSGGYAHLPGFTAYSSLTGTEYVFMGNDAIEFGGDVPSPNTAAMIEMIGTVDGERDLTLTPGKITGSSAYPILHLTSVPAGGPAEVRVDGLTGDADLVVDGVVNSAARITGRTSITPTAANTPTSKAITFSPPLKGANFTCQVTPESAVPGTTVTGVGYNNLSATGVTLWLTRTNTTTTNVSYTVEGTR